MAFAPTSSVGTEATVEKPPGHLVSRVVSTAVMLLVLSVGGYGFWSLVQFERRPLTLEGVTVPEEGDPEPFVRQLAAQWYDTELTLDAGSQVLRAGRRELGAQLDVEHAVDEARLLRGDGPIWSRVLNYATDSPRELRFRRTVNEEETLAFSRELRVAASVEAIAVRRDGRGGRPGTALNLLGTTNAIRDALRGNAVYVRLPVRRLEPPAATLRDQNNARFDEVVGAHETRYHHSGDLAGRARNIELATQLLDNHVIAPRGELSFNEIVGERTYERGFRAATELARGGRRTEGIGGGICQVAATLHAAAFFSGFDVVEHHPHTRNSTYIPAGLDSAVSWPNKDLRIRNPFSFHVRVRATAYRGTLRIELMGAERSPRVEWNTRIVRRIRRETEREVDPNLPLGTEEILDEGEDGSVMERTRTVFWDDGAVTETQQLRYPVVHRLVRSGPSAVRVLP